jgi:glucosamine--fructose-6-phosphate aminotransferase (isomerizing)
MCGIVGYVGAGRPVQVVLEGLRRLEYRGYDSAGIASATGDGLRVVRSLGRVQDLADRIGEVPPVCTAAIGHTRWATHGRPSEANAHPHTDPDGRIALVHNGIVENSAELRRELVAEGAVFRSETDTEVVAHLVGRCYEGDLSAAVEAVIARLEGTFAFGVIAADSPERIVAARRGSPLVLGLAEGATLLASDAIPILPHTREAVFLEDDQVAVLAPGGVALREGGQPVEAVTTPITWDAEAAEKGGYPHYMLKEIHEQPTVLETLVRERVLDPGAEGDPGTAPALALDDLALDEEAIRSIRRIVLIGQGTAFHACMVGRNLIERVARIPCYPEYASDFRYRDPVLDPSVLVIALTQSGETLDTLEGVRLAREAGCRVVSLVNVAGSSIARESDGVFLMRAGPEIGVASTKAFTAMIASLYLVAIRLGTVRGTLGAPEARRRVGDLAGAGPRCQGILATEPYIRSIARRYAEAGNALFLGRGTGWPLAMEGALKLKEVSYIHAEGYNAAEMKHGPIALIDENMPVIAIALQGRRYRTILGNIEEVKARGGRVLALASHDDEYLHTLVDDVIYVRAQSGVMNSILCTVPLQLLAYHIAVARGCDVDKPKNLAKSVTVR